MSLVPAFEIGLWNAWIFMPYLFLLTIYAGKYKKGEDPGKAEIDALDKTGRRIFNISFQVLFIAIIYSIFLPLEVGTIWFYAGLPIALIGLALLTVAMINSPPPHGINRLPGGFITIQETRCTSPRFCF